MLVHGALLDLLVILALDEGWVKGGVKWLIANGEWLKTRRGGATEGRRESEGSRWGKARRHGAGED